MPTHAPLCWGLTSRALCSRWYLPGAGAGRGGRQGAVGRRGHARVRGRAQAAGAAEGPLKAAGTRRTAAQLVLQHQPLDDKALGAGAGVGRSEGGVAHPAQRPCDCFTQAAPGRVPCCPGAPDPPAAASAARPRPPHLAVHNDLLAIVRQRRQLVHAQRPRRRRDDADLRRAVRRVAREGAYECNCRGQGGPRLQRARQAQRAAGGATASAPGPPPARAAPRRARAPWPCHSAAAWGPSRCRRWARRRRRRPRRRARRRRRRRCRCWPRRARRRPRRAPGRRACRRLRRAAVCALRGTREGRGGGRGRQRGRDWPRGPARPACGAGHAVGTARAAAAARRTCASSARAATMAARCRQHGSGRPRARPGARGRRTRGRAVWGEATTLFVARRRPPRSLVRLKAIPNCPLPPSFAHHPAAHPAAHPARPPRACGQHVPVA
jgi:hypothetical protein